VYSQGYLLELLDKRECPACCSLDSRESYTTWDDRYGFPGDFMFRQCQGCKTYFLATPLKVDALAELYSKYYPGFSDDERIREIGGLRLLVLRLMNIAPLAAGFRYTDKRVMDVGCGSAESSSVVVRSGGEWVGLEIDPKRASFLRRQGLNCLEGSLESISVSIGDEYDVILASQVIEHTLSPMSFLKSCSKLLKPNGLLILSSPNAESRYIKNYLEYWINWHCPYHNFILSQQGLRILSKACGYSIVSLETSTPATWWIRQRRHKRPSPGEKGQWYPQRISSLALLFAGICCRMTDLFLGQGDMLKAVFRNTRVTRTAAP